MKSTYISALAAFAVGKVAAHATFQQLWVNGVDQISALTSQSDSTNTKLRPVTSVTSNDIRCNANAGAASGVCSVGAGETVTVEMHQQTGDRNCATEAIGGNHYGPVMAYLSAVGDATTADGSTGFFKIYENSWAKNPSGWGGDDDFWGNRDMNTCCGRVDVLIPADIPAGDYLLRAETIALHSAGSSGGAQFYLTCYQITVTGGGSASPATVTFPGAYSASDPGITVNIHSQLSSYEAPGPDVYSGGSTKVAGSACTGCEATCAA